MSQSLPRPPLIDRPASLATADRTAWRLPAAAGAAVLAHAALLALALHWPAAEPATPPDPPGFGLIISPEAPRAVPSPTSVQTAPPATRSAPAPAAGLAPAPHTEAAAPATASAAALPRRALRRTAPTQAAPSYRSHNIAPTQQASQTAHETTAPQAEPHLGNPPAAAAIGPAPPEPLAADDGAIARLQAEIGRAVQAAARMPQAARRQRRAGSAQIAFGYLNGAVDTVHVVRSSQSRILDDAALQAVQQARYPIPPPAARGHRLALLVWIDFRLNSPPG